MGSDGSAEGPGSGTTGRSRRHPPPGGENRCGYQDPPRWPGETDEPVEVRDHKLDDLDQRGEDVERRRQLLVDQEIYEELALSDFAGPEYELFVKQIAGYGLAVMRAWIVTGHILFRCAKHGFRLCDELGGCTEEDVAGLANATVTCALIDFREKGLRGGGWRPDGGSSLRTYFITGCIYAFPNVYRSWWRERTRWRRGVHATLAPEDLSEVCDLAAPTDVAREVEGGLDVEAFYADLSQRQREVVFLKARGYSHAEIADLMGTSPRAVEGVLYRIRHAMQTGSMQVGEGSL